jgi:hypothetical protein
MICLWKLERYNLGIDVLLGARVWSGGVVDLTLGTFVNPWLDGGDPSAQGGGLWRPNVSSPSSNDLLKVSNVSLEG